MSAIKVATARNMIVLHAPQLSSETEVYPLPFLSAMFDLYSSTNQEVFEKHLCIKSSHNKKSNDFLLCKGSHYVQPPN